MGSRSHRGGRSRLLKGEKEGSEYALKLVVDRAAAWREAEVAVQAEPLAARLDERTLRDILRFADGCVVGSDGIDAAEVDAEDAGVDR